VATDHWQIGIKRKVAKIRKMKFCLGLYKVLYIIPLCSMSMSTFSSNLSSSRRCCYVLLLYLKFRPCCSVIKLNTLTYACCLFYFVKCGFALVGNVILISALAQTLWARGSLPVNLLVTHIYVDIHSCIATVLSNRLQWFLQLQDVHACLDRDRYTRIMKNQTPVLLCLAFVLRISYFRVKKVKKVF
jgi:hypothetical protein